jgi:hypothetical protein
MVQAIAQADANMKSTTGIHDASLGARSNETSGKAILARQKEGDVANFHFIDNLSRSIRHLGCVIVDLIPKIYDAPRVLRIVKPDGDTQVVAVNGAQPPKGNDAINKVFDINTGKYDVVVETGPSYNTKRVEAAESMMAFIQAVPNSAAVISDLVAKSMDWPMSQEIAERLKATLPPNIVDAKDKDKEVPPQIKAMLDQQAMMIEQLTGALQQAQAKVDSKQDEMLSRERIAAQNNAVKLSIAESQANQALLAQEIASVKYAQEVLQASTAQAQEMSEYAPQSPSVDNSVNGGQY